MRTRERIRLEKRLDTEARWELNRIADAFGEAMYPDNEFRSPDQLFRMRKALRGLTETNCGWLLYRLRDVMLQMVEEDLRHQGFRIAQVLSRLPQCAASEGGES